MARIRSIKPSFFASLTVANLSLEARLTFIGMWTYVDDDGRGVGDARLIKAAVWPLDARTAEDVEDDLAELERNGLIIRYDVGGKPLVQVTGWREHQAVSKRTASKFPPPEDYRSTTGALPEDAGRTTAGNKEGNKEGNREQGRDSARGRAHPIPDDFTITDDMLAWAGEKAPNVDLYAETDKLRDWAKGKGEAKKDWVAAWRNWMRGAQERSRGSVYPRQTNRPSGRARPSATEGDFDEDL